MRSGAGWRGWPRAAQVLVVTHSPAGRGARRASLAGGKAGRRAGTHVAPWSPLVAEARIDEIARMLAGDTITDGRAPRRRARLLTG